MAISQKSNNAAITQPKLKMIKYCLLAKLNEIKLSQPSTHKAIGSYGAPAGPSPIALSIIGRVKNNAPAATKKNAVTMVQAKSACLFLFRIGNPPKLSLL